jgi:hypothetical protein
VKLLDKEAGAEYSLRKEENTFFRGLFGRFFIFRRAKGLPPSLALSF